MQKLKLKLHLRDRVGIVADISAVFAQAGYNIVAMEVEKTDNLADVHLELELPAEHNREEVLELLKNIRDLRSLEFIDSLPREGREKVFRIVLDNVSEGVLSIDVEGRITTINQAAKEMFNCQGRELEGEKLTSMKFADGSLTDCLKGKVFTNEKRNIITEKGRFGFFATGKPIMGDGGLVVGAVEIMKDMKEIRSLAQEVSEPRQITFSDIIGKSPVVKEALAWGQKIAATDLIVSVRGDSGTGKELLARAIHAESGRPGPFITINCAALPETLLESELFGYVGGAFTGAKKHGAPGLFEIAQGGTILLDEIADLPPAPQAKLLRVIQEKTVRRIGGQREMPINTRIITSTNRNLEQLVEEKGFRPDLYYRINVVPIHIPPLRERVEDVPLLADHFLFQLATKLNQPVPRISPQAMNKLCRYDWPGNVRELKNVVERAAILCEGHTIEEDFILFSFAVGKRDTPLGPKPPLGPTQNVTLAQQLGEYEKQIITSIIRESKSIRQAARRLGISHTALLNKIKKHRLMER
ncbi:MAG: sigma 54-interacting transcriptional regulator [Pseudomonadota bacterium]